MPPAFFNGTNVTIQKMTDSGNYDLNPLLQTPATPKKRFPLSNTTPPLQQLTAYSYDLLNELTEAKFGEPSGNVTSPVEAVWNDYTYTYDGAGNRLTNNVSGWATAANTANLTGNFSTTATLTGNFNTDNSLTQQNRSGRVEVAGTVDKPAHVTANELPTRQWALPGGVQWAWTARP